MDSDGDTSSQPDQYARDNRLSIDSRINPFSLVCQIDGPIPRPTPDAGPGGLTSDEILPQLQLPIVDLREQLDMPKESIDLLARALRYDDICQNDQYDTPLARYKARKRLAELKLDPPALLTDLDYDCRELAMDIQQSRQPNISPGIFPPERLNINNDEGLGFPNTAYRVRQKLNHIVRQEKFDVSREAMYHLARALHDDWTDDNTCKIIEEAMLRRTSVRDLAVTPPLSPYTDHEEFFIPDAEVCEVPIASDSSSMLSDDLKLAESAVLQRELEQCISPVLDSDCLKLSPLLDPPEISIERPKVSLIKMESPLSPITSPLRPTNSGPNIPALLKSMDLDYALSNSKSSKRDDLKVKDQNEMIDPSLQTFIEESAMIVLKSIEQEHISIVDAIARVEVPITDFSIPEPEWKSLPMDARVHLKWLSEVYKIDIPPSKKNSRADAKLRWIPFLQNMDWQTLTKESIDCERDLSQVLNFLDAQEIPTSANYVWKQPGVAILRELECEECLEDIRSPRNVKYDLASLARKRRLENNFVELTIDPSPSSSPSVDLIAPRRYTKLPRRAPPENLSGRPNLLPSLESNLAVSTLLSNYMDMHTEKRRKQDKSLFFLPTSNAEVEPQSVSNPGSTQLKRNSTSLTMATKVVRERIIQQAPCPKIGVSNTPIKLIKGLTLSRGLLSKLEQLCPTAEIIERDFDRWNTVAWGHHSILRSTVASSLSTEADVIISPATGIIVTTLLKVIQKVLPGKTGQSPIRERINFVALRYERLIVLVSEGNAVDETVRDLTPSETTAYAEFIGFITGVDSKVEVYYVGGGEVTLAKWLVSFAVRYASEAAEIQGQLIQDETQWEVFLRRAGFNAYAAQAILVRLKGRDDDSREENEYSKYGLAAFMMMTEAERLHNFRDLMGGEKVLKRINRILETRWS
ncbi:hypothetical protein GGS24DRAFT_511902 [Hypoxylon argillaceum]|nr:hypothetical protein GGS24DRAFT_511902 [Hypoxylon argillaceum]